MMYMWFTGVNHYKLAVEKDRDSIFTTITTLIGNQAILLLNKLFDDFREKCNLFIAFIFDVDIDECNQTGICHANADCQDLHGTYQCNCKSGFIGDGMSCTGTNNNCCNKFNSIKVVFSKSKSWNSKSEKHGGFAYNHCNLDFRHSLVTVATSQKPCWFCVALAM